MAETRDGQDMKRMSARLLKDRTGEDVDNWNQRIGQEHFDDEKRLRAWLADQEVTGYAQSLLVMEHFGYPEFLLASADELIQGQYADRPQLRLILDASLKARCLPCPPVSGRSAPPDLFDNYRLSGNQQNPPGRR